MQFCLGVLNNVLHVFFPWSLVPFWDITYVKKHIFRRASSRDLFVEWKTKETFCFAKRWSHYNTLITTAPLAQVDKALNRSESNLFWCDTGSIWGRPIFFSVLFLYFLQKPRYMYLFKNKLRIERDLETDFLHTLLWRVNRSSVKANTIRTDRKEMWCIRALSTNILSIVLKYLVTCLVVERHHKASINP